MKYFYLLLLSVLFTGCISYSDGERVGTLIKFSKKGIVCKTWEGTMSLGGIRPDGDGNIVANVWDFTVPSEDPDLLRALSTAVDSGSHVKVRYHQEVISPCASETGYFLTSFQVIK